MHEKYSGAQPIIISPEAVKPFKIVHDEYCPHISTKICIKNECGIIHRCGGLLRIRSVPVVPMLVRCVQVSLPSSPSPRALLLVWKISCDKMYHFCVVHRKERDKNKNKRNKQLRQVKQEANWSTGTVWFARLFFYFRVVLGFLQ